MTEKLYYNDDQINNMIHDIIRQLFKDNWKPDYIVGITRGGLVPALKLSQYLEIPMNTLKVSLRDGYDNETNCWMAEDAYGYLDSPKQILIVDDINDTGATFDWIKNDWQGSCIPKEERWAHVWHNTVRFATLVNNDSSKFEVDYYATNINKAEKDVWCVFPWENWWNL